MSTLGIADAPRASGVFRRPGLIEALVLVVLAVIAVVGLLTIDVLQNPAVAGSSSPTGWRPGGYIALAMAVAGAAIAWRAPWVGLVVVAGAPLVSVSLGWNPIVTWNFSIFVAAWLTLRGLGGPPTGLLIGVANFAAVALAQGGFSLDEPTPSIAGISAIAAAGIGSAIRSHRQYWAELERRTQEALSTREAEADRQVALERVRIARDLHDGVGHQLALLSLRLGAAEVHLPQDADQAREDLAAVRSDVQNVLAGTQEILHVLRSGPEDDTTAPVAGYDRIVGLVETARTAGMEVDATIGVPGTPLTPAVSAASYRIAQEALTNAYKHGIGTVSLKIAAGAEAVTIETVNIRRPDDPTARDGSAASPMESAHGGYGLVGMRERAASVGGWIDTRTDRNTFWLWAYLPVIDEGTTP